MARCYGVTVKAYNVSREQIRTARERAKAEGLEGRVEFIEDDYLPSAANSTFRFDRHVGARRSAKLSRPRAM